MVQKVEIKLIDRKVAKAQQTKMAGSSGDNILIQSLKGNAVNKNTLQSTNNWVKVWKSWAPQKGHDESNKKYVRTRGPEQNPRAVLLTQQFVRRRG